MIRAQIFALGIGLALAASLAYFILMNALPILSFSWGVSDAKLTVVDGLAILCAAALVLLGNFLRALRTKTLLDEARKGSVLVQAEILAIGALANILIPLRVGEAVRVVLLARYLRVSLAYTAIAVLVERLLDLTLISIFYLIARLAAPELGSSVLDGVALVTGSVSVALLGAFVLILRQNSFLMRGILTITIPFSDPIRWRLRHTAWTTIHGFQRFVGSRANLLRYAALAVCSWVSLFLAVAIVLGVAAIGSISDVLGSAASLFLVPETLTSLHSFVLYVRGVSLLFSDTTGLDPQIAAGLLWVVLNILMGVIGIGGALFWLVRRRSAVAISPSGSGRLDRLIRPDSGLRSFVDSYLEQDHLAKELHQQDVSGLIEVIGFFKGGSDAVTALIREGGALVVRKSVSPVHAHRLRRQYEWLRFHQDVPTMVRLLDEHRFEQSYAIDLDYVEGTAPFFQVMHQTATSANIDTLDQVWKSLYAGVYRLESLQDHSPQLQNYVQRIHNRIRGAVTHPALARWSDSSILSIRGVQRRSLLSAIELSMTIPASLHDLKWYQQSSAIHGDLTIDNVLIDTVGGRPIIIDPSDDNEVRGPILDFARMSQSLDGGYEFLLQSPDLALAPWGNRNNRSLDVLDFTSAKYRELGDWLATYAAERMSPGEVRSLNFHVGLLFGRMLDHRLRIHPESAPAYYALAVEFLGRHLDQHLEVP